MTKEYPLLTKQNIRYWYWGCDPHWSQLDIANEVGCSYSLVSYYMIKEKIPRRDSSKAQFNRFDCPHKLKDFHETMSSQEVRDSISEGLGKAWQEPNSRRNLIKANQERVKEIIGLTQFKVLEVLYKNHNKSLIDLASFPSLSSFTKKQLDGALGRVYKRDFITRNNGFRDKKTKIKVFYYSINDLGKKIYEDNNNEEMINKLRKWHKINKNTTSRQVGARLGKVQLKIISLIKKKGPLFFSEIASELKKDSIGHSAIQHSLILLSKNKFLFRRKMYNKNSKINNKLEFKYSLDNSVEGIQESYKGLGSIQLSILSILIKKKGCFFREFKNKEQLKGFSERSIGNALKKLSSDLMIDRIKKKDIAPAGNNHIKDYYRLTKLGERTLEYVN